MGLCLLAGARATKMRRAGLQRVQNKGEWTLFGEYGRGRLKVAIGRRKGVGR